MNLGDIGPIFKIRVGHDNDNSEEGWYLKNIRLVDLFENQESTFDFDRWMSRNHDDKDVWRELPAEIPGKRTMPSKGQIVLSIYINIIINSGPQFL